jgi:hypothetical protein
MTPEEKQFRLAEIEITNAPTDEKIVGMFRYEPDVKTKLPGSKRGPILVILAEIASTLYVYEQLLDTLNETAEQLRHLLAAVDTDPMARFEKIIHRLNEAVAQFSEHEPTPIAWNRVNLFVLELSEGNLCLSGVGRLCNLFIQKQADGSFRTFDLFGSLEQPTEIDPKKPFASFICGDMKPGDILFAGTGNFERIRGELGVADRLKTLPPVTAAMELRQELERRAIPDDFAALVIACVSLPGKAAEPPAPLTDELPKKEKSTESIERMYTEEKVAEVMLSPAIAPRQATPDIQTPSQLPPASPLQRAKEWAASLRPSAGRSAPTVRRDPLAVASLRGMNAGVGSRLTAKHKLIIAGAAGALLLGVGGFAWWRHAKQLAADQTAWNQVFEQASERRSQAEADIVIGNEDQARLHVQQGLDFLSGLDEKTGDRKTQKAKLTDDLQATREKLRRELRVDSPTPLTSLSLGAPENSLKFVTVFKGGVFTVDTGTNQLVRVDLASKEIKRFSLAGTSSTAQFLTPGATGLLLLTAERRLFSINPTTGTLSPLGFSTSKASSTQAIRLYNKKPYVLDPAAGMIWKYASVAGGGEAAYLKQTDTSLNNAVDLQLDVNVYVAFADGKLLRFLSGVEESWSTSLSSAVTRLATLRS